MARRIGQRLRAQGRGAGRTVVLSDFNLLAAKAPEYKRQTKIRVSVSRSLAHMTAQSTVPGFCRMSPIGQAATQAAIADRQIAGEYRKWLEGRFRSTAS